jgi:Acyl-CoA dehydrogenase, C-terminal domain
MDVRLSPEQQALRDAAAQIVDRLGPRTVVGLDDTGRAARLRHAVETSGWLELRQRAEGDAPLASGVEVAVVAEELGRGLADVAFVGPIMAAELRRRAGAATAEVPETVLLDRTLSSPAWSRHGETPAGVAVDAAPGQAALVLTGGDGASGWRLGRVSLRAGDSRLDLTRASAVVDDGAVVVALETSVELDQDDVAAWTALGLALTCADLVGVMRGAFELARSYASTRRQYDAPIGSFQALQHLLADAYVAMEGSRSVALHAAWAVDALAPPDALAAAATAKAYCARAARSVCETSVQVHGGIGNTWDCLAHVFLRRALLSSELFGGADVNVGRVLVHHGIGTPVGSGHGLR